MRLSFKSKEKKFSALTPKAVHHQGLKKQNLIFGLIIFIIVIGLALLTIKSLSFLIREIDTSLKIEKTGKSSISGFDFANFEKIKEKLPELTPLMILSPSPSPEVSPVVSPESSPELSPEITLSPSPTTSPLP